MLEAAASAAVVEVYKDGRNFLNHISQKVDYAKDLENNRKRLLEEAKMLYARRDDRVAEADRHKTKQVTEEYKAWISRVENIKEDVQKLEDKYNDLKKKENKLLNWVHSGARARASKRMAQKCEELCRLWSMGNFERGIVAEKLPEPVRTMHAPKTKDLPSLYCVVEEILGHLRDESVSRIGLWGRAGTGKTTIMQYLNDNEDIAKMFEIVILVTVSKDCSVEKLQRKIVQRLKLNMKDITDPNEIAWRISEDLERKRYLLLLDDVWGVVDLDMIGFRNNGYDSKVVFASRNRDICHNMEVDDLVNVKRLSEADAWKLFLEKVGRYAYLPGIEPIAKQVASECAGWPLVIDRVAKAFRKKDDIRLWNAGLSSLRRWPSIKDQGMDEMIEILEFCYEDLGCDFKKRCFLYCVLYPEECEIYVDYLLECWKAEGFIHGGDEFSGAHDKGYEILDALIRVSLLEWSEKKKLVRMNKVLRNMALKISLRSNDFKVLVRTCEELREPPNEVEWQQANWISLIGNKLYTLLEVSHCNNLSTLLLQRNHDLIVIPEPFFEFMKNLRVLDLHGTGITSLPSSVSCLTCLRALYLNSCIHLRELSSCIEGLEQLELLDIRGTRINYIPIQIGRLIRLRCLRMSLSSFGMGESREVEFRHSVFSSLYLLEVLRIDVDSNDQWWESIVRPITQEVATLTNLTNLSICFPKVDCLEIFMRTSPLWKDFRFKFKFLVGYHDSTRYQILDHFESRINRCLKLANSEGVDRAISEVLAETRAFELINHKGALRLSDFGIESINNIRGCLIEGCNEIETIIDGNGVTKSVLECLEKMYINNVHMLKSIWEGPIHVGSLARLTTLALCKCLKLKKIFSNGMIEQLSKLQHLRVEECPEIEEIIMETENNGLDPSSLPSLKILVLSDLSRLRSIWTNDSFKWPSLEKIEISMCQLLTRLPFSNENAVNLKRIEGQRSWWNALVWKDDAIKQRLHPICNLN